MTGGADADRELAAGLLAVRATLGGGDVEAARRRCRQLLDRHPEDGKLLALAGIASLLAADPEEACDLLRRARRQLPDDPRVLANLGEAWRRAGDAAAAREALERAVELAPRYPVALHNLGTVLFAAGDFVAALALFERALREAPGDATFLTAHADALRELGRYDRAVAGYRRALERDPQLASAHSNLGPLLLHRGLLEEAEAHCRQAVELAPDQGHGYLNLGRCLVAMERLDEAMDAFADAFERMPASAVLCTNIAQVWREMEDLPQAEHWFLRALAAEPGHLPARCGLAVVHREADFHDEAIGELERLAEEHPERPEPFVELAEAYWDAGDAERSVATYRSAAALRPQAAALQARIGHVLASAGAVDEALDAFRRALEHNPRCVPALHGLAVSQRGDLPDEHAARLEELLAEPRLRDGALGFVHNALAHYFDGRREYARAAEHAARANEHQWAHRQRRGWEYDPADFEAYVGGMIELFDSGCFARARGWGREDARPAFVVGMPRSGTTLTEQILACHRQVLGIGERDFASRALHRLGALLGAGASPLAALRAATPAAVGRVADEYLATLSRLAEREGRREAARVVDKLPDNYSLLGWLVMLFPGVRIIHCRREPRDVAVSCWMTQFAKIRWACTIEPLAHRIRQYQRIMEHWRQVLPVPMLEIDYEELVADTEGVARRMVAFLGLEWDAACLRHAESDRLVRTASVTQVRQPVYRRSVDRWRRYQPYLDPLFAALGTPADTASEAGPAEAGLPSSADP